MTARHFSAFAAAVFADRVTSQRADSRDPELSEVITVIEAESHPADILQDPQRRESLGKFGCVALAEKWMRQDPDAALDWMRDLAEYERELVSPALFRHWMDRDRTAAFSWFDSLPDGEERASVCHTVAESLRCFKGSREELESEIATFPADLANDVRLLWIAENDEDPASAAKQLAPILLQASSTDSEAAKRALARIANSFTEDTDFNAMSAWALALPEGSGRTDAIQRVVENWRGTDVAGASSWIAALPPGADRDNAVAGFVQGLKYSDPESAAGWAQSIEDDRIRRSLARSAYEFWLRSDPVAAVDSLAALAPEERVRLLAETDGRDEADPFQ